MSNPTAHTLERAATLTNQPLSALKTDDAANIVGGAAVLRAYADDLGLDATARKDPAKWYPVVAKYGNAASPDVARLYATPSTTCWPRASTPTRRPVRASPCGRRPSSPTAAPTPGRAT